MDLVESRRNSGETAWIAAILAAVICEGALRKWVLPQSLHPAAYLAKDIIGILYIVAYMKRGTNRRASILRALGYSTAVLLMISLIVGLGAVWQSAIITYKNAVLWPIVGACLARSASRDTWKLLPRLIAPIAIAMCVLGAVQFFSPASSWLNQYAWTAAGLQSPVATFGGIQGVRATGTFSYIAGMSQFAVFSFLMCLHQFLGGSRGGQKLLLACGCLAAVGCAVESGSRAPIVMIGLAVIGAFALNLSRMKTAVLIGVLVAVVIGVAALSLARDVTTEYLRRWTVDPEETLRRFTNAELRGNYWEMLVRNPVGIGLGQANGYAMFETSRRNQVLATSVFDDGASIAVYEGGLLGLLAFCLAPVVMIFQVALGLGSRGPESRLLAATLGLVSVLSLVAGVWHDHNAAAFTWLQIGVWFCIANGAVNQDRAFPRSSANVKSFSRSMK